MITDQPTQDTKLFDKINLLTKNVMPQKDKLNKASINEEMINQLNDQSKNKSYIFLPNHLQKNYIDTRQYTKQPCN